MLHYRLVNQRSDDLDIAKVTGLVNGKDFSSDDDLIDRPLFPNDFERADPH